MTASRLCSRLFMVPFLRLDDVLLPPPGPAVVASLVLLGVLWLGLQTARLIRNAHVSSLLTAAAGFVIATASIGALVQALTLSGFARMGLLRVIGGGLAAASLGLLSSSHRARGVVAAKAGCTLFSNATLLQRWVVVASVVTLLGLTLASLGPPTDIDTLAYHLSVPLDWLAHGGAHATPDWLHARLVGIGESINMLGLAVGTDCLGSAFQAAGVLIAIAALTSVATSDEARVFAIALVASCPVLVFLTSTSKPQLLPAATTSVALALLVQHRRTAFQHLNRGTLWMIFGCVNFAVASKYSFIPAGVVLTLVILHSLRGTAWVFEAGIAASMTFAALALPMYARNLAFYGDPLSPILERWHRDADPVIAAFSWYLRNFSGNHSFRHLLKLPWELIVATHPADVPNVLGAGALAVVAVPYARREAWTVLAAAAAVTLVTIAIGQLGARFFLESYLWFGLAAVLPAWNQRRHVLFAVIAFQMLITTPVAAYSAVALFPGALTSLGRERIMTRLATDYALSKWLDDVLPKDAIVATDRRSRLFMPRPYLASDLASMIDLAPVDDATKRARLLPALVQSGATTLVVAVPPESSPYRWFLTDLGAPIYVSPEYPDAVRNPWNQGQPTAVLVYDLGVVTGRTVGSMSADKAAVGPGGLHTDGRRH